MLLAGSSCAFAAVEASCSFAVSFADSTLIASGSLIAFSISEEEILSSFFPPAFKL